MKLFLLLFSMSIGDIYVIVEQTRIIKLSREEKEFKIINSS